MKLFLLALISAFSLASCDSKSKEDALLIHLKEMSAGVKRFNDAKIEMFHNLETERLNEDIPKYYLDPTAGDKNSPEDWREREAQAAIEVGIMLRGKVDESKSAMHKAYLDFIEASEKYIELGGDPQVVESLMPSKVEW